MRRAAGDGGIHGGLGRWMAVAIVLVACALPVEAIDLSTDRYTLKLDTALSWGGRYRVEDPDLRLIGLENGGTAFSVK